MTAMKDLMDQIKAVAATMDFRKDEDIFYRGHSDGRHPLLPSLMREQRANGLDDRQTRALESALYFEFRARAQELQTQPLDSWDWLFMMRHHGLPSRLLDWTEILGIAIYFALEKWTPLAKTTPCVWLLHPARLNKQNRKVRDVLLPEYATNRYVQGRLVESKPFHQYLAEYEDFPFDKPLAIYPQQKNRRQQVQRGWFTVHGNDHRALEELNPDCVRRVDIPPAVAADCKEFIKAFGFDRYLIYPDLDSLALTLRAKYLPADR